MRIFVGALEGAIEFACIAGFLVTIIAGFALATGHL
jgi:hypothetical protein